MLILKEVKQMASTPPACGRSSDITLQHERGTGSDVAKLVTPLLITLNEADNIERTLPPLRWAREIVVVDSGSTDGTLEILAREPRARVVERRFDTFAGQCNFGLAQIRTPWVLSLDADYELAPELVDELQRLSLDGPVAGYRAKFIYRIFGKPLRATIYPPRIVLYRADRARYRDEGHGHRVEVEGPVADLMGRIFHDDRKPIGRWFRSQISYARREADHLLGSEPRSLGWTDRLRRLGWAAPAIMPFYMLLVRGCLLDGQAGLYYTLQRTLAELMLALEVLDRRLRESPTCKFASREPRISLALVRRTFERIRKKVRLFGTPRS